MEMFAGHFTAFDKKKDETNNEEPILIEVTKTLKDGTVEIAFDDRNERCYVKFRIADLLDFRCGITGE